MKRNWTHLFIFGILLFTCSPIYGRLQLTRLTAQEVYKALREAGRMDAVPEGRVVTQGIAAATGFIAGVAKGVGIPMLVGLVAGMGGTNNAVNATKFEEICFSSRSAFDVNDDDDESDGDGVDAEDIGVGKNFDEGDDAAVMEDEDIAEDDIIQGRLSANESSGTGTNAGSPSTTTSSSPDDGNVGSGTTDTDGVGSGTVTASTTKTDDNSVSCIVIQKEVAG